MRGRGTRPRGHRADRETQDAARVSDAGPTSIAAPYDGLVLVGGLDPATSYTFSVGPTGDGQVAVAAGVQPAGQTLTLSFVPGVPTRGVARFAADAGGVRRGVARVEVGAWTPDAPHVRVATVTTKDDGSFAFPGIAPGRWVLRVEDVDPWGETEAEAGSDGIVVELNRPGRRPLRAGAPR